VYGWNHLYKRVVCVPCRNRKLFWKLCKPTDRRRKLWCVWSRMCSRSKLFDGNLFWRMCNRHHKLWWLLC
jgi:hypothetical protein